MSGAGAESRLCQREGRAVDVIARRPKPDAAISPTVIARSKGPKQSRGRLLHPCGVRSDGVGPSLRGARGAAAISHDVSSMSAPIYAPKAILKATI